MTPSHFLQFLIFSSCIHMFTVFIYIVYYTEKFTSNFRDSFQPEYDFIIVGSGSAGSLIAHRLATETNYTFIVLEAGSQGHSLFDVPVLGPLLHSSVYDWQYETVPQENACYAMKDKKCKLPQGKIFGGSSKLNNMVHVRGNISLYVGWFHGKYSANYIERQFKVIEKDILYLEKLKFKSELADAVLKASSSLGYEKLGMEFGKGFVQSKVSQKDGKRWTTSHKLNANKNILFNALVENVIIHGNTACGVNILLSNSRYKLTAKKGVILSAGAYNSPKILQLSGIGPPDLLKSHNMPIVKELPVGKNLQDHVTTGLDLILFNHSLSIGPTDMMNPVNLYQYFVNGNGPLTTPGCEVIGFLSTQNSSVPDLQFTVLPVGISSDRGSHLRKSLGINEKSWKSYFAKTFDKHTATILPIVLHPRSKGYVHISSLNSKASPIIDPKYLTDKNDVKTLIEGLKLVTKFVDSKPMKDIGAFVNPNKFPGCESHTIFSEEYWECYIRHLTLTSYHPVGTCSMGPPESKKSVVDTNFKVVGVNRLFVVDGSVLPTLPSGNINAAIIMMANVFYDNTIRNYESMFKICYIEDRVNELFNKVCQ